MVKHYRPPGKKKEGNAAKYVTRSQALKLLQISLPLFRRLCIFKGIQDLWMHLENWMTVLQQCIFLQHYLHQRVKRLKWNVFINVGDWHMNGKLSYLALIRKTFVSVKGIYYQAEVEGQTITWMMPHPLQQVVPDDVDITTMLNFLQFYETLLDFVNFHLYHSINVKYPPILDPWLEALAADLYALSRYVNANARQSIMNSEAEHLAGSNQVEAKQMGVQTEDEKSELRLAQLQHQLLSNEPGALINLVEDVSGEDEDDQDTKECKNLFKNMKFFLSREVPRESMFFIIPAFAGTVSWEGEGAPFGESDQSITHQVVDREAQGHMFLSREYVQPQWMYDSVNARIILPTEDYMVL